KSRIVSTLALAFGVMSAALTATAAPLTGAAAHGSGWNSGGNNGWGNNGWHNNGWAQQQVQTLVISIDRYVGNEILPLRQLGSIDHRYNGHALRSVRVKVHPWS